MKNPVISTFHGFANRESPLDNVSAYQEGIQIILSSEEGTAINSQQRK